MAEDNSGYVVVRFGDREWERRTEDDWPPLVKRMHQDPDRDLSVNIIWYAHDVVEPRHVHGAIHATWVLLGSAQMDGQRIGPHNLIYGPSNVPHGPLTYEVGCLLFGTLKGSTLHSAVADDHPDPAGEDAVPAHMGTSADKEWAPAADAGWPAQAKIVVRDEGRDYTARMVRWPAGSTLPRHSHAATHAALIVGGVAVVDGVTLGPWDLLYATGGTAHGGVTFPVDTTLLVNSVGDLTVAQA